MAVKKTGKNAVKKKTRRISGKKFQRGTIGNFFVFGILALLMTLGITAVGGLPSQMAPISGQVVNIITPTPENSHSNLQLQTFGYVTIAPTPTPPSASLCNNRAVNTEPIILTAYYPGTGQSVGATGQIKVWVNDERPPFVAPGEQINTATGQITTPGNRTAKAPDGYLDEPSLYIAPGTEEAGGSPHFPDFIKGQFNNSPSQSFFSNGNIVTGPKPDPIPAGSTSPGNGSGNQNPLGLQFNMYNAEYIWNVANLGLSSGTYQAEFVIHDGDIDRGVGCVSISIQ